MTTAAGDLSSAGRRALLGVLTLLSLATALDLVVGARHTQPGVHLALSAALTLATQALLVLLVWQRRRWAWVVGAVWAAVSAAAGVALIADPAGIGGYTDDVPTPFVLVQALLLVTAAALWFVPGVRPRGRVAQLAGRA